MGRLEDMLTGFKKEIAVKHEKGSLVIDSIILASELKEDAIWLEVYMGIKGFCHIENITSFAVKGCTIKDVEKIDELAAYYSEYYAPGVAAEFFSTMPDEEYKHPRYKEDREMDCNGVTLQYSVEEV